MSRLKKQRDYGGGQRRTQRFPVDCEVKYTTLGDFETRTAGCGRAVNMSSKGVLFTTEHCLEVGQEVELSITWPAKLDGKVPLKLVVVGSIVRSGGREAAVQIQNYDFRIRGRMAMEFALAR